MRPGVGVVALDYVLARMWCEEPHAQVCQRKDRDVGVVMVQSSGAGKASRLPVHVAPVTAAAAAADGRYVPKSTVPLLQEGTASGSSFQAAHGN